MVDDNFAKVMNENKLEDKIRFTLDAFAIERKYMCGNGLFSRLWIWLHMILNVGLFTSTLILFR